MFNDPPYQTRQFSKALLEPDNNHAYNDESPSYRREQARAGHRKFSSAAAVIKNGYEER
jgi:hypothetical protein